MDRRLELEKIIIGTLLYTTEDRNYFRDCRSCITEEMFSDETNRRLYHIIAEMNGKGMTDICPLSILDTYGDEVRDLVIPMVELNTDYDFVHKKTMHNERQYLLSEIYGIEPKYTEVKFSDYVNAFVQMVFDYEKAS